MLLFPALSGTLQHQPAFFIWVLFPPNPFFTPIPFFSPGGYLICCIPCFPFHEQKLASGLAFSPSLSIQFEKKKFAFYKKKKERKKWWGMLKELGDKSSCYIHSQEEGCKEGWREHPQPLMPRFLSCRDCSSPVLREKLGGHIHGKKTCPKSQCLQN